MLLQTIHVVADSTCCCRQHRLLQTTQVVADNTGCCRQHRLLRTTQVVADKTCCCRPYMLLHSSSISPWNSGSAVNIGTEKKKQFYGLGGDFFKQYELFQLTSITSANSGSAVNTSTKTQKKNLSRFREGGFYFPRKYLFVLDMFSLENDFVLWTRHFFFFRTVCCTSLFRRI